MHVLVSGASGFVGSHLVRELERAGHRVTRLVRRPATHPFELEWEPGRPLDPQRLELFEGVVHLAGENLAGARWSREVKQRIRDSRLRGTYTLAEALARTRSRPKTLVSASAVGFYGSRGDEVLREDSGAGTGFLADLAREWERATEPAARVGLRVVIPRFGFILGRGGALDRMLLPFRLGVGGRLGSGKQWMSWVAIDDVTGALRYALENPAVSGVFNLTAPNPATNAEFTKTLASVLRRPAIFPAPEFALRLAMGEMTDELLFASQRVDPARLKELGYQFKYPELRGALEKILR